MWRPQLILEFSFDKQHMTIQNSVTWDRNPNTAPQGITRRANVGQQCVLEGKESPLFGFACDTLLFPGNCLRKLFRICQVEVPQKNSRCQSHLHCSWIRHSAVRVLRSELELENLTYKVPDSNYRHALLTHNSTINEMSNWTYSFLYLSLHLPSSSLILLVNFKFKLIWKLCINWLRN